MLPLYILSAALPLLSGAHAIAVEGLHRRNETDPGGPVVNATSASATASTVPTLSSSSSVNPGGQIINATTSSSVNPSGPLVNATSTTSLVATSTTTNPAEASSTSILNDNTTQAEYVACVSDSSIASLVDTEGFNSTDRDACSDACIATGTELVAYFNDADNLCYCVEGDETPTSGEVVYAIDNNGTCRNSDDASVEFLYAPYPLAGCYLSVNSSLATNTFTDTYAVECFYGCTTANVNNAKTNATQTVGIRPQLNSVTKQFEYACTCYPAIVDGTLASDCGFGTYALYHD